MSATARDVVLPSGETHGDTMREPHRTRFIEMIRRGAAARDIHDSDGSGDYDSRFDGEVSERFLEREISRVAMHAQSLCAPLASRVGHAPRILDVGCGTGRWTEELAGNSAYYHGIDFSAELIDHARASHPETASLRFSVAPAENYSLAELGESQPFDRILCCGVMIYLNDEDVVGAFRCMASVASKKCRISRRAKRNR